MTELNLLATDLEDDLRATVRDLLVDRCDPTAVVGVYDGDRSLVADLHKSVAVELGLAGLLVPEDRCGAGATAVEAAVVLEELGRAAALPKKLASQIHDCGAPVRPSGRLPSQRPTALDFNDNAHALCRASRRVLRRLDMLDGGRQRPLAVLRRRSGLLDGNVGQRPRTRRPR